MAIHPSKRNFVSSFFWTVGDLLFFFSQVILASVFCVNFFFGRDGDRSVVISFFFSQPDFCYVFALVRLRFGVADRAL